MNEDKRIETPEKSTDLDGHLLRGALLALSESVLHRLDALVRKARHLEAEYFRKSFETK